MYLQTSLNAEQKSEMSSIAGMGFPSPRVARALLRCKEDKTKVKNGATSYSANKGLTNLRLHLGV